MTSSQIQLVQSSWEQASPIADTVVRLFYRRLFEQTPELREAIHTSMSEQGDHLLESLQDLLEALSREEILGCDEIGPVVVDSSTKEDFVAEAWTWSLRQEVGRHAPPATCDAWRSVLQTEAGRQFVAVAVGEQQLATV